MPLYFSTFDAFDYNVLRFMGVSAKPNSDNPIGQFGTGLKYSVATLLRLGCSIHILDNGARKDFATQKISVRGKEVDAITLDDEVLPFTLEYGKNWTAEDAYRELESNTRDEDGGTTTEPTDAPFQIIVTGAPIEQAHAKRHEIFLSARPLGYSDDDLDLHEGATRNLYFKGVRVYMAAPEEPPFAFTYNFKKGLQLSEDRKLSSFFAASKSIVKFLTESAPLHIISTAVGYKTRESRFDYNWSAHVPSAAMQDFFEENRNTTRVPPSLRALFRHHFPETREIATVRPDEDMQKNFAKAVEMLRRRLGITIGIEQINVIQNTEEGGLFEPNGRIYLSLRIAESSPYAILSALLYAKLYQRSGGYDSEVAQTACDYVAQLLRDK